MKLFKNEPLFYKKVFALALPIALQSLITIGVNMLDTIMVGKLGEEALSATSLANSFISIYHIFCMGLGMGASVLVSRFSNTTFRFRKVIHLYAILKKQSILI